MSEFKSPQMIRFLDSVTNGMFGRERSVSINTQVCVVCGEDASQFNDALSKKEFKISGLCQRCQDSVFGE